MHKFQSKMVGSGLAVALAATSFLFSAGTAFAQGSPLGCTDNDLNMSLTKDVAVTTNGSVVHFEVIVSNTGAKACDVTGAAINFIAPDTSGNPAGTNTSLGSGLTFSANGTPDCWTSVAATCPGGTTEHINAALAWTTNVNSGVSDATAQANQTGSNPATFSCPSGGAVLHDTLTGHTVCQSKTVGVEVVDAKISITPNGTNEIGHKHVFTGHVQVNSGSGFVDAPDGTVISFASASGPGTFDTPTCTTAGGTGSCNDGLTSATPGVTVVNASTDVTVEGILLHRTTNGSNGNSGSATKTWVDANIQISPLTAQDPINDNHILTGHVNVNTGTGGYVNAPAGTSITLSIQSGPGSLTTTNPCLTIGTTGSCTVTLTSPTTGTTVIRAATDVTVGGVSLHKETNDGKGTDSVDAQKTWVSFTAHMTTSIHEGATDNGAPVVVTSVPAGTTVHDSATVTGTNQGDPVPTGNVTFTFWSGGSNCDSGQSVGAGTVALNNGVADPSSAEGPLGTGSYAFKASYAGDANYPNGATSDCEPLTVTQLTPLVLTDIHDASHNVITTGVPGITVHDKATVSGGIGDPVPTGNVSFSFYNPGSACTGDAVATAAGTVALDGSGIAHPSTSEGPLVAGTYAFKAHYAGDGNYAAADGQCEPLTINKLTPNVSTTIHDATHNPVTTINVNTVVHDSATVGGTGGTPTGTVDFTWYTNGTCSAGATSSGTGVALFAGVADPSGTQTPAAAGSYSFKAHYNGDGTYAAADGPCEPLTVNQPAGQYCSPGYWKQPQHFDSWVNPPYNPSDPNATTFSSVFSRTITISSKSSGKGKPQPLTGPTLLQALGANGGGINLIAREAVDALMNASKLQFGFAVQDVVTAVQQAIDQNDPSVLDKFNLAENCPLN